MRNRITSKLWLMALALFLLAATAGCAQSWLDNNRDWTTSSLNPDVNSRSSDHFQVFWGNADSTNPDLNTDFGQVTEQLAQGNLQMLEQEFHVLFDPLASGGLAIHPPSQSLNPTYQDGNFYRAKLGMNQTGIWGGGAWGSCDGYGFPIFGLPPSYLRFDPPSGATPHEYGHTIWINHMGFNNTPWDGDWHEAMANWTMLQLDNDYPPVGNTVYSHAGSLPHGRNYYDAWPIMEFLKDDPNYGSTFVDTLWLQAHGDQTKYNPPESMFQAMARLCGATDGSNTIKDELGRMQAHCLTWDFQRGQTFRTEAPLTSDSLNDYYRRGFTELIKEPGSTNKYRVPWEAAPMLGGFDFIPIALTGKSSTDYKVGVNFQPLWDGTRGSDWRACFVAINTNGEARYSNLWNDGTNYITLSKDENTLYLVVASTPKFMGFGIGTGYTAMGPELQPQAYELTFVNTSATPYESPAQPSTGLIHLTSNGGGYRSSSATVAATAYVGPNARVLGSAQVLGYARIEDYAVVTDSAVVKDNAIVSGHAVVRNNAQVSGNAKVRDWGTVVNSTQLYGYGKVLQGAYADNDNIRDNATVKGWTYDYVDGGQTIQGVYGYGIKDGDCANGSTLSKGVLTCWVWGFDQNYANSRPDNGWRYCEYSFENYSPIFAKDTYGITHGYLMGASAKPPTVASGNTARGQVLSLNGVDQYIELMKDVCDFGDCTISTWVKWNSGSTDQVIWSMGDGANKYMTLTQTSGGQLRFAITNSGSGGETALTTTGLTSGAWTHLAITFSSGTVTLYVNGAAVASSASSLNPDDLMGPNTMNGGNCNYVGRGNSGNYFAGYIDLFAVYQRALTASEIAAIAANTGTSATIPPADTTAPTPNAATWLVTPTAVDEATILMSATEGTDASGMVEYYFTCTSGGGHDSGWISSNRYTDCALTPGTAYTYTVMMRDRYGNTTAASTPATVSTLADSGAPTPNPATFAYGPIGNGSTSITMTATKGSCSGQLVEYKFDRMSPTVATSGWQSSPTWTDTGLTSQTRYYYKVTMRNIRGTMGTSATAVSALAKDDTPPTRWLLGEWAMRPYATIDNCISMTAKAITDTGGVEYSFECTSGGGPNSGWTTNNTFKTTTLADGTYTYRFRVRQQNITANVTGYSQSWNATINQTTGYHTCTISQLATLQDHFLADFNGTVMRVNTDNYYVKDIVSGATITVKPAVARWVTNPALALKNVNVQGHLFTYSGSKVVTFATVTATGDPTLYNISGRVTNIGGAGIANATIYLSDAANPSANPITTTTTDTNGYYSKGVTNGTWYLAASAYAYNISADQIVVVNGAAVPNVNFILLAAATVSGKVTNRADGTAISGATVYFSKSAGASGSPVYTTTTDSSGNYTQPLQDGTWYACAGGTGYFTSGDKTLTINGVNIPSINFVLTNSNRNIPRTDDLLFSAVTESLPATGNTGNWPTYIPSGQTLTAMNSPTVDMIGSVKWEKNLYSDGDGFRQGSYTSPIAVNGVTICVAVKPSRNTTGTSWTSCVDIMYNRLVLTVQNSTGLIRAARNGAWNDSSTIIPSGQTTILTLVCQSNGNYKVFANGAQVMNVTTTSAMTSLDPTWNGGGTGFWSQINVGRNDPDGWTVFNGDIGDVFVYKVALTDAERLQLEADLTTKFSQMDYTITSSAGAGGTINPTGAVIVNSGGSQTFTITPNVGYAVSQVTVDSVNQGAITSYTFNNVTTNHTISATFVQAAQTVGSITDLEKKPAGTFVNLAATETVIYAPRSAGNARTTTFFYIGEAKALGGLKVLDKTSDALTLGNRIISLTGYVRRPAGGEIYLELTVDPTGSGNTPIPPVGVGNRSVLNDPNVPTNTIVTWGRVTSTANLPTSFTITDGWGTDVTVNVNGVALPSPFDTTKTVIVTGVVSADKTVQAQTIRVGP